MNDPTMMLIFDLVKPKPNQFIISPKCMYSENVVQFHLEVFVDSASVAWRPCNESCPSVRVLPALGARVPLRPPTRTPSAAGASIVGATE